MKYKLLSLFVAASILASGLAPQVFAAPSAGGGGGGGVEQTCQVKGDCAETAFKFGDCKQTDTSLECLFTEIITFLSIGVGIAVVAGIAIGGIQYSTSQGNPAGAQKGITTITNSIIGLVLYLLMFALLQFLVPGGVLT